MNAVGAEGEPLLIIGNSESTHLGAPRVTPGLRVRVRVRVRVNPLDILVSTVNPIDLRFLAGVGFVDRPFDERGRG